MGRGFGAGAGGFLLVYVNKKNHKKFKVNMKNYEIIEFKVHEEGSKIIKI